MNKCLQCNQEIKGAYIWWCSTKCAEKWMNEIQLIKSRLQTLEQEQDRLSNICDQLLPSLN